MGVIMSRDDKRVSLLDWSYITAFVAEAGLGAIRPATNSYRDLLHTKDFLVEVKLAKGRGNGLVKWEARLTVGGGAVRNGEGSPEIVAPAVVLAMFELRMVRMVRTGRELPMADGYRCGWAARAKIKAAEERLTGEVL